jgi:hypothetical protein
MTDQVEELLRGLAVNDDRSLRAFRRSDAGSARTRALVRLAALLAVDASTTSLRWAVEQAAAAGVRDEEIVGVLRTVGETVGFAGVVAAAPRLALAIGYDIEAVGWDGS